MDKTKVEVDTIKDMVSVLKQYMTVPLIQEMKHKNYNDYEKYLGNIFPTFVANYPTLFYFVIKDNDISFLDSMFKGIIEIAKDSNSKDSVEKKLGEDLAETYLYPKIGHVNKKQRI